MIALRRSSVILRGNGCVAMVGKMPTLRTGMGVTGSSADGRKEQAAESSKKGENVGEDLPSSRGVSGSSVSNSSGFQSSTSGSGVPNDNNDLATRAPDPYATKIIPQRPEDYDVVKGYLDTIATTERGSYLLRNAFSRSGFVIMTCHGCGLAQYQYLAPDYSNYFKGVDRIVIDLDMHPRILTEVGFIQAGGLRILAHELGHAGTWTTNSSDSVGDTDLSPFIYGKNMRNVILNETPIMRALG